MLPSILVSFQNEWAFLCACASPASTTAEISALLASPLDWNVVLDVAEHHGVSGLLARRLGDVAFAGVPVECREQLQARIRAQHLFTLSMTADLFRILQDFSAAHIDTMLVKGPLISLLAYGDPSLRRYVDMDLLVRHRDMAAATRHMLDMGFHADIPESAILAGKIPGEYLFRKPGTQRIVELHTEHTFRYYPKHMPLEDLFARSTTVLLDGREVPALSLEDELILTCVHGAKHFWSA